MLGTKFCKSTTLFQLLSHLSSHGKTKPTNQTPNPAILTPHSATTDLPFISFYSNTPSKELSTIHALGVLSIISHQGTENWNTTMMSITHSTKWLGPRTDNSNVCEDKETHSLLVGVQHGSMQKTVGSSLQY